MLISALWVRVSESIVENAFYIKCSIYNTTAIIHVGVRFSFLDILHCLLPLNVTLTPLHLLYLVNFDGENNSEIGTAK